MDEFNTLVAEFYTIGADKCSVIEALGDDDFFDERVPAFFAERLLDTREDVLVRCQVLNEIIHRDHSDSENDKRRIADAVYTVILRGDSDDYGIIRQRACEAVAPFVDVPGVAYTLESIASNEEEEEHVRITALDALIEGRGRVECAEALSRLRELPEYRAAIDRGYLRPNRQTGQT